MTVNGIYKSIAFAMLILGVATAVWLYATWKHAQEENEERLLDESRLIYTSNALKKEKNYKNEYYYRLVHDDEFAERVIREKLGYAGKNEIIFRFKDSTPLSINSPTAPRLSSAKPLKIDSPTSSQADKTNAQVATSQEKQLNAEETTTLKPKKSLLRRWLFGDDTPKSPAHKEIVPQVRIDMSKPQVSQQQATPAKNVVSTKREEDLPKIGVFEASEDDKKQNKFSAPRAELYAPKKNVSTNRTQNSIRFRTD